MPTPVKFFAPLGVDHELRERARREGRTLSDTTLRAVERGLALSPAIDMPEAAVDVAERNGHGGKAVACYLSGPISGAVRRLADEAQRSQSWTVRDLLRCELRRRGLLSSPADNRVDAALEVAV
jgi:hypothetical protein